MTIANLTQGPNSIKNGLQILEKNDCNEERVSTTKRGIKNYWYATRKFYVKRRKI